MTETGQTEYRLCGKSFDHADNNVFPPFYASRSDELWSNPYLEELRGKRKNSEDPDNNRLNLLDVGTGSGITAIHWLKLMPDDIKKVTLTDNSESAIECAKKNIKEFFPEVEWYEKEEILGHRYIGSIEHASNQKYHTIGVVIEKTNSEVWPKSIVNEIYDYIVFNGPHLNKDKSELRKLLHEVASASSEDQTDVNRVLITNGLLDGICDPGLQANHNFIKHLHKKLDPRGYALLTFSDYSKNVDGEASYDHDPLENLLTKARENNLVATFLSVSEFCPGTKLAVLNNIKEVPKRKIMLWKNIILRVVRPSDSNANCMKINLHKTCSGFLAAASQIADIYCTKEPVTPELYIEMTQRMQAFYRMFCEQVGWANGIENDFIISGFSLPKAAESPDVSEFKSWIYGRNVYSKIKDSDTKNMNKFEKEIKEFEKEIKVPEAAVTSSTFLTPELGTEKLHDTNIHRLEIKDLVNDSKGYYDMNAAMNAADSQRAIDANLIGTIEDPPLQVRYRIQLDKPAKQLIMEGLDDFLKDKNHLIQSILRVTLDNFAKEASFAKNASSRGDDKHLSYCLFSRYSGPPRKSAVFYLLSSTEDLPFLPSLRSFGRIANTAANNMLTSLFAYEAAKKAARAAVFARNFSHITGSHVISNPEFRHSLAGEDLTRCFRKSLDESYNYFIAAESELFKLILQNPYRTKELWTNVTKTLAEARDNFGSGDVLLENTRRFHEYLQGRFDFIARAIDDTKDQPEPVWFVKDLLGRFLTQTAYLDNVVADVGLRRDDMEFYVVIEDKDNSEAKKSSSVVFIATWEPVSRIGIVSSHSDHQQLPLEVVWTPHNSPNSIGNEKNSIEALDVMVGLPGGMVAAHAFYSLLENIIRNSAKYGRRNKQTQAKKDPYRLTIQLESAGISESTEPKRDDMPFYRVRIYDNFSLALNNDNRLGEKHKQPWYLLQKKLEKNFVKDNYEPQTEDLGMMEMQACAQLLCKPAKNGYPGERGMHVADHALEMPSSFNLWTTNPNHEYHKTCNHNNQVSNELPLTYNLTLNMPILLACLTRHNQSARSGLLIWSNELEKLLAQTPFVLVIDGEWLNDNSSLIQKIDHARNSLPYRILVIYTGAEDGVLGQDTITQELKCLRGVKCVCNPVLYDQIFSSQIDDKEKVLFAYQAWLRAWKPPPIDNQWHLWIGLDRESEQVKEAWAHSDDYFNSENTLVRVMVKSYSIGHTGFATRSIKEVYTPSPDQKNQSQSSLTAEKKYWQSEQQSRDSKKVLLFDNHGNCFPEAYGVGKKISLENSTRFYQKLSGTVSPDLFRMLSGPPKDKFGFCFFIFSLVEACLANVVVVDERMAWSLVEGSGGDRVNDRFSEDLLEHQKAGVFPVFRFRQRFAGDCDGYYNLDHKERLEQSMLMNLGGQGDQIDNAQKLTKVLNEEGITYEFMGKCSSELVMITPEVIEGFVRFFKTLVIDADVILIHEGAMDILTSQQGVEWNDVTHEDHKKQLQALYQLAPMIIRTSGRGRKSKLLGEHLPFIEFGQVSSALLTARNKFSLVRGLLGSVGRMSQGR